MNCTETRLSAYRDLSSDFSLIRLEEKKPVHNDWQIFCEIKRAYEEIGFHEGDDASKNSHRLAAVNNAIRVTPRYYACARNWDALYPCAEPLWNFVACRRQRLAPNRPNLSEQERKLQ